MWKREKHFSALLSAQGIDHIYLPGSRFFKLSSGEKYTPDFYLPKRRIYVEVVGSRQAYHSNKKKYELFQRDFPTLKIIFVTMDGKTFTASTRKEFDWKLIDYVGIFLSCPRCNRRNFNYLKTVDVYWCRLCGAHWTKKIKK